MSDTHEEIVGRVFHGLRDAAPLDGMESRILNTLRHRASSMPVSIRRPWRIASLAGGAVLACAVCALFFTAHRETSQVPLSRSSGMPVQVETGFITAPERLVRTPPKPMVRRARLTLAAQPKEELAAVSYPAPPMPLTEQEKLLLRIVHRNDPVQIAMLDPLQREAKYADERAQVQRFFSQTKQETPSEP